MKTKATFTVTDGFKVQNDDLARWHKVLNQDTYLKLWGEAKTRNSKLKPTANGYDVWRGGDLNQFIADIMHRN